HNSNARAQASVSRNSGSSRVNPASASSAASCGASLSTEERDETARSNSTTLETRADAGGSSNQKSRSKALCAGSDRRPTASRTSDSSRANAPSQAMSESNFLRTPTFNASRTDDAASKTSRCDAHALSPSVRNALRATGSNGTASAAGISAAAAFSLRLFKNPMSDTST